MHEPYDNESAPNLLKWAGVSLRSGNRGHSLKLYTQRTKINLRKNAFPLRVAEVIQVRSMNSFKNRLDKFGSTQAMLYDYEALLTLTTGNGNYELLILDSKENMIIEFVPKKVRRKRSNKPL